MAGPPSASCGGASWRPNRAHHAVPVPIVRQRCSGNQGNWPRVDVYPTSCGRAGRWPTSRSDFTLSTCPTTLGHTPVQGCSLQGSGHFRRNACPHGAVRQQRAHARVRCTSRAARRTPASAPVRRDDEGSKGRQSTLALQRRLHRTPIGQPDRHRRRVRIHPCARLKRYHQTGGAACVPQIP